jgi:hypothetical protein
MAVVAPSEQYRGMQVAVCPGLRHDNDRSYASMRRQHPFISLPGFALTALFLLGLGISIWKNGGLAFSPGNLSAVRLEGVSLSGFASHADFEEQCGLCHAPLKITQAALCLACHTSIRDQVASSEGYHGRSENIERCGVCHSEHYGSEFNPGLAALKYFDHELVNFRLGKHLTDYAGLPIICSTCHLMEGRYSDSTVMQCISCHELYAPSFMLGHIQEYGPGCLECHDGQDRMVDFDHTTTAFLLLGKHKTIACAGCHARSSAQASQGWTESFQGLSPACVGCHAEPLAHQGVFDSQCADCHTEDSWVPALWQGAAFNHAENTRFSLALHRNDYDGQSLTCTSCHATQLTSFDTQLCSTCHSAGDDNRADFMRSHAEQFGNACLDCHDGTDRMMDFDHQQVFPLDGVHGEIECTSCHIDRVFHGIPRECVQCHAEPEIHKGIFGVSCQDCHAAQAWVPARLQVHDFPLDHGDEDDGACTTCHVETYISYTCYGCHEHQLGPIRQKHIEENVALEDLANCVSCHADGE